MSPGFKIGAQRHESASSEERGSADAAGGKSVEKDVGGGLSDMTVMTERGESRGSGNDKRFCRPACAIGWRFLTMRQRCGPGAAGRLCG